MTTRLSNNTLHELSPRCPVPRYRRNGLGAGIVHIGVGGFNRSHLCVYLDDLLERGDSGEWAEFGVGLMEADQALHDALAAQDYLYGVLARDAEQQSYRVIGSLLGHLYAPGQTEEVIRRLGAPETKIISLTVTEGGYFVDDATKEFQAHHEAVKRDFENPGNPRTWLGFVAAAAEQRMRAGAGFTLLSCDNLRGNGDTAKAALLAYAELCSSGLRRWIETNVSFPNSMVDRITPRTTQADRETIARDFGVDDLAPVVCEPFRQWVLEDNFAAGRPRWEQAGAHFTGQVELYEKTKMRLLNGGHFAIAYCSALLDIEFVADAMADDDIRRLLQGFLAEAATTLHDLPGVSLSDYSAGVLHRFANPAIRDQVARICSDGSAKISKYVVPTVWDLLAEKKPVQVFALVIASWLRYLQAATESGRAIAIEDTGCQGIAQLIQAGKLRAALADPLVFGSLAAEFPAFAAAVEEQFAILNQSGVRAAIRRCLKEPVLAPN